MKTKTITKAKRHDPIDEPQSAAPAVDAPSDSATVPTGETSESPTAAAPIDEPQAVTAASGLVRCRVKATAGDFHLEVDGQHVPMAPGTELSLTPEQVEGLAAHVEPLE